MIAERATPRRAARILFEVLKRDIDYLYRYHAASALIKLLRTTDFEPVDLSADRDGLESNLNRMEKYLTKRNLLP